MSPHADLKPDLASQSPVTTEQLAGIERLAAAGQLAAALEQCLGLVHQPPYSLPWLALLAALFRQNGQAEKALDPLRALVQADANNHLRYTDIATLYYELRNLPDAERNARQALVLNPFNAQAHNLLGMIHLDVLLFEEAEFHFRQLLLLHEPLAPVTANLAHALASMGRLDEAEIFFRHTLELDPANADGLLAWARMEEARRNFDLAARLLDRVDQLQAGGMGTAIVRSVLLRRQKNSAQAWAVLVAARHEKTVLPAAFYFAEGEVLDQLGRYDEAFTAFDHANRLARETRALLYAGQEFTQLADHLKAFFQRGRVAQIMAQQAPYVPLEHVAQPIFIVGFPRSGTTLTEQILATHPHIAGGDELDYLHRLVSLAPHLCQSSSPYPACLEELGKVGKENFAAKFRNYYLYNAELRGVAQKGKARFTDKMPLNETHMGLLHLVFPAAPIVHLIRHPLDVVLSCYFNDLTHGGNCSYSLEAAARHYMLVFDLIAHYRRELDLNYLAVRYEDIVTDPERHVRELLAFVDEPYNENCLAFHENQRYARTASYAQVTEKLYVRSCYRYRNYLPHLASVIPILRPAIEQLGYSV